MTPEEVQGLAVRPTVHYVNRYYEKDVTNGVVTTYYYHGNRLVALRKGTTIEYVHQDHLGGTIATTNTSGAIAATQEYYAFGELRSSSGTLSTDRKFTGQRLDATTGLYFYNARYYDASVGRFTAADPIVPGVSNPQAWNRFSYVTNNPTKYVDPSGLWRRPEEEDYVTFVDWDNPTRDDVRLSGEIRQQHEWAENVGLPQTSEVATMLTAATSLEHVVGFLNFWLASDDSEVDHGKPGLPVQQESTQSDTTETNWKLVGAGVGIFLVSDIPEFAIVLAAIISPALLPAAELYTATVWLPTTLFAVDLICQGTQGREHYLPGGCYR
ncbi:MAG: RHS repeat-associated core domain-containing protein [Chloroflexi bacterium]|nr:RHS repeat-associated core domain-containing protein [Chloroflexota bacterium]